MSQPKNLDEQLEAARHLRDLLLADMTEDGLTPEQGAATVIVDGIKRTAVVAVEDLPHASAKVMALATAAAMLGEFVGRTIRDMPPSLQQATLATFADELNTGIGRTISGVCATPRFTPKPQETQH